MNVQSTNSSKKEAILKSTLRLIKHSGFHGTPMSQIALDAGVAIGTIYHYFSSKDELIFELFEYTTVRVHQAMLNAYDPALPYKSRFYSIWDKMVNHYIEHSEELSFLEQFYSSPFSKMPCVTEKIALHDEISNLLNEGLVGGYLKNIDINIMSTAFLGTVTATAKRNINGHYEFDKEQMAQMVGILWDGIETKTT